MDSIRQGLYTSSGVVLRRNIHGEGDIGIYVFLRELGPIWINAPGSARGKVRFGGATEPMTWGVFNIYKSNRRFYLKSVEVKEDLWKLKSKHESLKTGFRWLKLLCANLLEAHPDDKLLGILYWSFILLVNGVDPALVNWRFLWRWLNLWGLAPDLRVCPGCGRHIVQGSWTSESFLCSSCIEGQYEKLVSGNNLEALDWVARVSHGTILEKHASLSDIRLEVWRVNSIRLEEILARSK